MSNERERMLEEMVEQLELITTGFAWWSNKTQKEQVADMIHNKLAHIITKVREEEREYVKEKLSVMYKPAGFDELSADVFHRTGYNLAIDDITALLTPTKTDKQEDYRE